MAAATLLLCSFAARPSAHDPVTTRVTFDREIRAILDARCGACHASRGSAPIPFTTYEDVRPWARAIKEQVLSRKMPKWHAARGFGAFADDPSLTPLETSLIVSWVDGGLPRNATAGNLSSAGTSSVAPAVPGAPANAPLASASPGSVPAASASLASAPAASASLAGAPAGSPIGSQRTDASASLPGAPVASASLSNAPVASAFRRKIEAFRRQSNRAFTVRANGDAATALVGPIWIGGWSFEPGDPLITTARISSASGPIATWVAGDPPVTLPATHAVRATGTLKIEVLRRAPADYESPFTARRSVLRLVTRITDPDRRVWVEEAQCGQPSPRTGSVLAIRPLLARGGSARLWLQRPGAPASVLGWFRNFDPAFARSYWLARPVDLSPDARLQSDSPCRVELTLAR